MPERLIAGNWKMNGQALDFSELDPIIAASDSTRADTLLCVPATLIAPFAARAADSRLAIGGQDCHPKESGAHTGEISAGMLAEAGAVAVIVGHSERRTGHGETDALVCEKAQAAQRAGLVAVICVGETTAGQDAETVTRQLDQSMPDQATSDRTVVAYEPIWAIGTGRPATPEQIAAAHSRLRAGLRMRFGAAGDEFRILYGGSINPTNAAAIFAIPEVDGGLVGGASLTAEQFLPILAAAA